MPEPSAQPCGRRGSVFLPMALAAGSVRTSAVVAMDFFGGIPGFQTGSGDGPATVAGSVAGGSTARRRCRDWAGSHDSVAQGSDLARGVRVSAVVPLRQSVFACRRSVSSEPSRRGSARQEELLRRLPVTSRSRITGSCHRPSLASVRDAPVCRPGSATRAANRPPRVWWISGVSGHYAWERRPLELADSWAGSFEFALRRDWIGAAGEAYSGENIDAFGGALGLDARATGGWAELQLKPTTRFSIQAGRESMKSAAPRRRARSRDGAIRPSTAT